MSGVRAASDELNAVGLTLPGFVERRRVIASLPSLSLLTLAALTPPEIEVEYHEVRDLRTCRALPRDFDLVAISTYSAQVRDAYELAGRFRGCGVPVVMGGLHVTALPDEALRHASSVVVGEGEPLWPLLVEDFRRGRMREVYQAPAGGGYDLSRSPVPRYDLLEPARYNRLTVQTSRGCPHLCSFCASSVLLTPRYRVKPADRVLREVRAVKEIWPRPFLEFADDDSFVRRDHAMDLLRALRRERVSWFTEADVSIADDEEILDLMRRSGCRQVLVGLESPVRAGLDGLEIRANWKARRFRDHAANIETIQSHGITVNGCFILGLDGHDETVFDAVNEFVEETGLYEVQVTVLTPFPGTPLHESLRREGRILEEGAWHKCTLFDVNYRPAGMSPERLQRGIVDLGRRLYHPDAVRRRRERFFRRLRAAPANGGE